MKRRCGNLLNMLNVSDQTELVVIAVQKNRTPRHILEYGRTGYVAQTIAWNKGSRPARPDARLLPFAADVAVARPRSRDAAIPSLAA